MPGSKAGPDEPTAPVPGARILPMAEEHLDQVLATERRSFGSPWVRRHFQHELNDNRFAENWIIELDGRVLGYACIWHLDGELKINNIAVVPECRRRGLARFLLLHLLARAREAGCGSASLEVRPANVAAQALYRRHGFEEVGRRKNYYATEAEDAIVMRADLRSPPGAGAVARPDDPGV